MERQPESLTLDGIDLSKLCGEQKERVLKLANAIRSDSLSIESNRFNICLKISELDDIIIHGKVPHGSYEDIREKFFPAIPERSLQRYTAIGRMFGEYREQVQGIGFSYLGKLAEQEKLSSIRLEIMEELESGGLPDAREYRAKIKALLKAPTGEDKIAGQDDISSSDDKTATDGSEKAFHRQERSKKSELEEGTKDLVDQLVPTDLVHQKMLLELLGTTLGKKQMVEYVIKRLKDLVKGDKIRPMKTARDNSSEAAFL